MDLSEISRKVKKIFVSIFHIKIKVDNVGSFKVKGSKPNKL